MIFGTGITAIRAARQLAALRRHDERMRRQSASTETADLQTDESGTSMPVFVLGVHDPGDTTDRYVVTS